MHRGFTLLEVLITICVLSVVLIPLLLSLRVSGRSICGTRDYLGAVSFAQEALEELRHAAFRRPAASSIPTVDAVAERASASPHNSRALNGITYTRSVRLYPGKDPGQVADLRPGQPDLMVVQINVSWQAPGKGGQQYQLASLVGSAVQP